MEYDELGCCNIPSKTMTVFAAAGDTLLVPTDRVNDFSAPSKSPLISSSNKNSPLFVGSLPIYPIK